MPQQQTNQTSGIRLFQVFGITVYLHWTWFLLAYYEFFIADSRYENRAWSVLEYLSVFAIVLLHEFGHALACRSVGGEANRIMLWPLGGVAFVKPPQRPAAVLWSIAAGPLVNVILVPLTFFANRLAVQYDLPLGVQSYTYWMMVINAVLLAFNLLPIYPLDGGQILQSLMWFVIGRAWSLMVAAVIGVIGAVAVMVYAFWRQDKWLIVMALFGAFQSWVGIQQARILMRRAAAPRRPELACPHCHHPPIIGDYWACKCGQAFDTFAWGAKCPRCGNSFSVTQCLDCGKPSPLAHWWIGAAPMPQPIPDAGVVPPPMPAPLPPEPTP